MVLDLIAALPDGAAAARVAAEDWGLAATRARSHGIGPLLHFALRQARVEIPSPAAETLSDATSEAALLATRVRSTLRTALACLERAQIPVIVLKGWPLAERLYPAPELRSMLDVDLLVESSNATRAKDTLIAQGGRFSASEATQRYHAEHHHHWPPIEGVGPASVEIHFRGVVGFGVTLEAAPLFERALPDKFEAIPFLRMGIEDEALYLAAHGAGHLYEQLCWLLDLKLLAAKEPGLDWEVVRARAVESGFGNALDFSLALLRRVRAAVPSFRKRSFANAVTTFDRPLEDAWYSRHRYLGALVMAGLADSPLRGGRFLLHNASRAVRRRAARYFPSLTPEHWGG